jgi:hypothetical protein
MKEDKEQTIVIEESVEYIIVPELKENGCRNCDLFGKRCDKLFDEKKRPSCISPNIVFKVNKYYPNGNKNLRRIKVLNREQ